MSTLKTYEQLRALVIATQYDNVSTVTGLDGEVRLSLIEPNNSILRLRNPTITLSISFPFDLSIKDSGMLKLRELLGGGASGEYSTAIRMDFMYHWMTNFSELSTFDAIRTRMVDIMGSASLATAVAVNKYIRDNNCTDSQRASLLAGSKFRWSRLPNGDYVQTSLYFTDLYGVSNEGETLHFTYYNANMFEEVGDDVEYRADYSLADIKPVQQYIYRRKEVFQYYQEQEAREELARQQRAQFELKSYGSRATEFFEFKKGKTGQFSTFLGVELELEGHSRKEFESLNHLKSHAIFKRDGSLREGVEICTAPATLDVHKEAFLPFFQSIADKKSSLKAMENCGMHVHIDRSKLSSLHIANICLFLNNKGNEEQIKHIAGRGANHFCKTVDHKYQDFLSRGERDRYSRVNLQNDATIEVRMFASTTNFTDFCTRLEFTQAVVDYTRPGETNITCKEIPFWHNFKDYLLSHRKFYPTLVKGI